MGAKGELRVSMVLVEGEGRVLWVPTSLRTPLLLACSSSWRVCVFWVSACVSLGRRR